MGSPVSNESAAQLRARLSVIAHPSTKYGFHSLSFQPAPGKESEDRHIVQEWQILGGVWRMAGVFDGHGAGHEAVDYTLQTLAPSIKSGLEECTQREASAPIPPDDQIANVLVAAISALDDRIKNGVLALFPGGAEQIAQLTDDEIRDIIRDPSSEEGLSYVEIMRARTGTTVLVALIDPSGAIHVASLGDCEAYFGVRSSNGVGKTTTLSRAHSFSNPAEAERIHVAHPGEPNFVSSGPIPRLFGLIPLTRAIGDMPFKLPPIYTERVFALATPPFYPTYKIEPILRGCLSPPYMLSEAEVVHFRRPADQRGYLVLCSDGLVSLYDDSTHPAPRWMDAVDKAQLCGDNMALAVLWDALSGGDGEGGNLCEAILSGKFQRRVDDTTILVAPV